MNLNQKSCHQTQKTQQNSIYNCLGSVNEDYLSRQDPMISQQFDDYFSFRQYNLQYAQKSHNQQLQSLPVQLNSESNSQIQSRDPPYLLSNQSQQKKPSSKRNHLKRPRRKKGQRYHSQRQLNGYPTKNFLPAFKNSHFNYIKKFKNLYNFKDMDEIKQIELKDGINMQDYVTLYNHPKLRNIWKEFFSKKIPYRDIMNSRVSKQNRKQFMKHIHRFEQVYKTKTFDHIADMPSKNKQKYFNSKWD